MYFCYRVTRSSAFSLYLNRGCCVQPRLLRGCFAMSCSHTLSKTSLQHLRPISAHRVRWHRTRSSATHRDTTPFKGVVVPFRRNVAALAGPEPAAVLLYELAEEVVQGAGLGLGLAQGLAAVALAACLGVLAWRTSLYYQLEYITAAMLSRWVTAEGARVVQLGGGTRELYYYPKSISLIINVSETNQKGLIEQAGIQIGVPVIMRKQAPTSLAFQQDSSVDAVVSIKTLAGLSEQQRGFCINEVARILKPGGRFIFVEPVESATFSPLRPVISNSSGPLLDAGVLDKMRSSNFGNVEFEVALDGQDPHVVGVATLDADSDMEKSIRDAKRQQLGAPGKQRGFNKAAD